MRIRVLLGLLLSTLGSGTAMGEPLPSAPGGIARASHPPHFADYPARIDAPAQIASPVLTGRARAYRTRLREAGRGVPNFAGHYFLASWGCGTECLMGAAINARTGQVTFLPFATCCFSMAPAGSSDMVSFRPASSLIVLMGMRDQRRGDVGAHYYRMVGDRFVHLRSVPFPARR